LPELSGVRTSTRKALENNMKEPEPKRIDRAEALISAPREAIWAAFADSKAWISWLPPSGMHGTMEHFDFRPGGRYRLRLTYDLPSPSTQGKASDDSDIAEGRFVEIDPLHRIVQEVEFPSDDPAFAGTMRMTWLLEALQAGPIQVGTVVKIIAENVPAGISQQDHEEAFRSTLANLARFVGA
jgi:uncharacterized protein YndB with AHSA1/START domain